MIITDFSSAIPIEKASVFNTALPSAEGDILSSDITPTSTPTFFRIYVCIDTNGILRVVRTVSDTTITENLNSGVQLVADAAYMFTIEVRAGDSINFRYSTTGGTIKTLRVDEICSSE